MSTAVATAAIPSDQGYISLAQAARLAECHPTCIQRWSLRGLISHRIVRGRPHYCRSDVVRVSGRTASMPIAS